MPHIPPLDLPPVPPGAPERGLRLAVLCARAAYGQRGREIQVLEVGELCSYADYFVIATGQSRPQLRAMAGACAQAMKASGCPSRGVEGTREGGWVLIDFGDVVVQLFEPERRSFYQLEDLWADAPEIFWQDEAVAEEGEAMA